MLSLTVCLAIYLLGINDMAWTGAPAALMISIPIDGGLIAFLIYRLTY
jgi:hypothetical protein